MAYDLEEQEQLDTLKAWWKQYGNLVTWLLLIVLSAYAGWTLWNSHQRDQSQQASQLFEELKKASTEKEIKKVKLGATELQEKFSSTSYASMGTLYAAKSASDSGDIQEAKKQLNWILAHGKTEEYKAIARLRLAGIALDEKSYEVGLNLLAAIMLPEFAGDAADRKGDILYAQNKLELAREAYQLALEKSKYSNPSYQLIQLKLDAVGGKPESKNVAVANESNSGEK